MGIVAQKIKTKVLVEADFIIAGVFFAARNGWELLRDARMLHSAGSFASAYGLAVFCREELGKSKIWQEQWNRCRSGECVTLDDLKLGGATNHRTKLARVGKHLPEGVFSQGEPPEPGSSEEAELAKKISEINVRARQRDPEKSHTGRLHAFFVEPGGNEFHAAYGQPRHLFDRTGSRSQILEAEEAYDRVRRELIALTESDSLPHTVLTILPEIHADGHDAVLLGTAAATTHFQ
ncbi:MAG: AbiV family abortive infection protein [Candidatus Acidiferrum sp.]